MSALQPGFYRATVEGVPNIPIMVTDEVGCCWTPRHIPDTPYGTYGHELKDITDARPLVTLDLDNDHGDATTLAIWLRSVIKHAPETIGSHGCAIFSVVADQIEAQTKPARIPEPTQSGVRVTANLVLHDNVVAELMRLNVDRDLPWVVVNRFGAKRVQCGWQFSWDALLNQKVVAS